VAVGDTDTNVIGRGHCDDHCIQCVDESRSWYCGVLDHVCLHCHRCVGDDEFLRPPQTHRALGCTRHCWQVSWSIESMYPSTKVIGIGHKWLIESTHIPHATHATQGVRVESIVVKRQSHHLAASFLSCPLFVPHHLQPLPNLLLFVVVVVVLCVGCWLLVVVGCCWLVIVENSYNSFSIAFVASIVRLLLFNRSRVCHGQHTVVHIDQCGCNGHLHRQCLSCHARS
jgi:hypothetical protein